MSFRPYIIYFQVVKELSIFQFAVFPTALAIYSPNYKERFKFLVRLHGEYNILVKLSSVETPRKLYNTT